MKLSAIFLLCIAFFMFPPLQTGSAQSNQETPEIKQPNPGQEQALLKSQITANLDTVATLLNSRTVEKKKVVTVTKKRVYHKVIKDTVYIDTCIDKEPLIIALPAPEQPEIKPEPAAKKIKWYRKIFHKKVPTKSPAFF